MRDQADEAYRNLVQDIEYSIAQISDQPSAKPLPPPCEPSAPLPRTTVTPQPPAPPPCQAAPR